MGNDDCFGHRKRTTSDQFYSFTIDKGTLDGVSYQDPVITADGLVGIVSEVGPVFAEVTTILDVRLNVACQDVRTQDVATISGDIEMAQQGKCKMSLIPRESGIAKGDIVQTAGCLGTVSAGNCRRKSQRCSDLEPQGTMMYAVVEPANDIKSIKDVVIITSFKGQGSSLSGFEQDVQQQQEDSPKGKRRYGDVNRRSKIQLIKYILYSFLMIVLYVCIADRPEFYLEQRDRTGAGAALCCRGCDV